MKYMLKVHYMLKVRLEERTICDILGYGEFKLRIRSEIVLFQRKKVTPVLLMLAAIFMLSFPALAFADVREAGLHRLAGYDRYKTATEIAQAGWPESEYALLAYGENYPDALASAPLARKYDAPTLLTTSNSLPATTKQTLRDLQVKNVIIIGGTGVIFASVDAELQEMGINVSRVFGYDKYETAVEVARRLDSPSELFVVTGEDFPDALSAASIAGIRQTPIILVPQDTVPDSVKAYISAHSVNKSYIVGDSSIISDEVGRHFSNAERILGSNRYARNVAINKKFAGDFTSNIVSMATGEIFADALTGTAYAAKLAAPIVLVSNNPLTVTKNYCQDMSAKASNVYVFGGTGIIPDYVLQNLNLSADKLVLAEEERQIEVNAFMAEVLRLTNVEREKEGLKALVGGNALLDQAAAKRASEAIVNWAHTRPNGKDWFTVFSEFGINWYTMAGENLYCGSIGTPEDAVDSWMDSPGHRDCLMRPEFTQLGVGVDVDDRGVVFVSQLFMQE